MLGFVLKWEMLKKYLKKKQEKMNSCWDFTVKTAWNSLLLAKISYYSR